MYKKVGLIGGGQLGRMLTEAATALGVEVRVIDPNPTSPASQVGASQIVAGLQDAKAIHELAAQVEVISVEIEHLNADALSELESLGKTVEPTATTIKLIQDKLTQNQFFAKNNIPVADFIAINGKEDIQKALKKFKAIVLKSRFGGFDGRGNAVVKSQADIQPALKKLGNAKLYAEKLLSFNKELAVMVARDTNGNLKTYPVVETFHKNNICHLVLAPAPIEEKTKKLAEQLAKKVVAKLDGAGMFGVEMFLTSNGQVVVNEVAPRVHNSGHYTIEGCKTSQFEQHIRAVTSRPLGDTSMKVPAAAMINILGERDGPVELMGLETVRKLPDTYVHLYGKSPTKIDRKMGHITAVADTIEAAKAKAEEARSKISI